MRASLAPHPLARAQLTGQANAAVGEQRVAARAASRARGDLGMWQRRGRDAYLAYMQKAQRIASEITALEGELRHAPVVRGGAPVPISVSATDARFAQAALPALAAIPASLWAKDPAAALHRLSGGEPLTPSQVLAVVQAAAREQAKGNGSIVDAGGGFLSTLTLGAVSIGDPNTARYRGGALAAMIPVDPAAFATDADRALARIEKVIEKPGLLARKSPADLVRELGPLPSNWHEGVLYQGTHEGQGWALREVGDNGKETGRYIRYHPGGGHHGPRPYWRVASPKTGKSDRIPAAPQQ